MAQQVKIAGALFNDVPYIQCPDVNDVYHAFYDTTIDSNAASATDIASGKKAYVNGALVTGSATVPVLTTKNITANGTYNASSDSADGYSSVTVSVSGGGGGLEYETGIWTPSSDIADYTIPFVNTHTAAPFYYLIYDSGASFVGVSSCNTMMALTAWSGGFIYSSSASSGTWYGTARFSYASSASGGGSSTFNITNANTLSLYTSSTGIRAYTNNDIRYWRAGRTYKWIAVWAPTS